VVSVASTVVRAHQHAAGALAEGFGAPRESFDMRLRRWAAAVQPAPGPGSNEPVSRPLVLADCPRLPLETVVVVPTCDRYRPRFRGEGPPSPSARTSPAAGPSQSWPPVPCPRSGPPAGTLNGSGRRSAARVRHWGGLS
jgi:hypothetical protein